jgi:hypothetical protein
LTAPSLIPHAEDLHASVQALYDLLRQHVVRPEEPAKVDGRVGLSQFIPHREGYQVRR